MTARKTTHVKRSQRVAESPATYVTRPTGISSAVVRRVVSTIAKQCHPDKIVVFGSCAHGRAGAASDLDLLVIMDSTVPRHKRAAAVRLLFDPTPCPMDILVFTPAEVKRWDGTVNHIVTEALSSGVLAYEKPQS